MHITTPGVHELRCTSPCVVKGVEAYDVGREHTLQQVFAMSQGPSHVIAEEHAETTKQSRKSRKMAAVRDGSEAVCTMSSLRFDAAAAGAQTDT